LSEIREARTVPTSAHRLRGAQARRRDHPVHEVGGGVQEPPGSVQAVREHLWPQVVRRIRGGGSIADRSVGGGAPSQLRAAGVMRPFGAEEGEERQLRSRCAAWSAVV